FAPRLPSRLDRLAFSLLWHGLRLRVEIRPHEAVYSLRARARDGDAKLELRHHREPLVLTTDAPVTRPIPTATPIPSEPAQPADPPAYGAAQPAQTSKAVSVDVPSDRRDAGQPIPVG
ncbi:glycosyl hydrolase family 65 protein, partial [Actinoplanes solisilvae]|uniref:glycosyl hydrolase family 65 protein n=1 Tax=Actinoplanes solisilvae TaxID=2486853 RepID=UPI0025463BEA